MGNIYAQLSLEERTMIHTPLEMGLKPAAIANGLNRPASTLSRELTRNGWIRPKTRGGRLPCRRGAGFAAYDRDLHCGLRSSTI